MKKIFILSFMMFFSISIFSQDITKDSDYKARMEKVKKERALRAEKRRKRLARDEEANPKEIKQESMFIKKGNRVISYIGIARGLEGDSSKQGVNLGGEYLFHIVNNFFVGLNFDYSLFFYSADDGERSTLSSSNILAEGVLEFYSTEKYSFELITGFGINVFNIAQTDNATEVITLGIGFNYQPIIISFRYNIIGFLENHFQTMGLSLGFLFDFRPKKLNKGYYNDEF